MKIKYSNKINDILSKHLLQELIQLSYVPIPYQAVHCFSFESQKENESCIIHRIPNIKYESKIYLPHQNFPNEEIFIIRNKRNIYILTRDEYSSL